MSDPHLIYFADPMCSWCWGFSPVIDAIAEVWGESLPIRLVMGGLRPGPHEPMSDDARAELREHWRHVTELSGQGFGPLALSRSGFVYDTDPAARAVVVMRRERPERVLPLLKRLHEAFYLEGLDVTDPQQLAELAGGIGADQGRFLQELGSEQTREETTKDYALSQGAGVRGFPTLILGPRADGAFNLITRGYQGVDVVLPAIAMQLEQLGPVG